MFLFITFQMKSMEDQIKVCRYLFTGCIFVDENKIICGNKTMYADEMWKKSFSSKK